MSSCFREKSGENGDIVAKLTHDFLSLLALLHSSLTSPLSLQQKIRGNLVEVRKGDRVERTDEAMFLGFVVYNNHGIICVDFPYVQGTIVLHRLTFIHFLRL